MELLPLAGDRLGGARPHLIAGAIADEVGDGLGDLVHQLGHVLELVEGLEQLSTDALGLVLEFVP